MNKGQCDDEVKNYLHLIGKTLNHLSVSMPILITKVYCFKTGTNSDGIDTYIIKVEYLENGIGKQKETSIEYIKRHYSYS